MFRMPTLTLPQQLTAQTHVDLSAALTNRSWFVCCLCAAWCDACRAYRTTFEQLAIRNPQHYFIWIDIEDHADFMDDVEVENFPTLLIQQGDRVAFIGTVTPDGRVAERLLQAEIEKTNTALAMPPPTTNAPGYNLRQHINNLQSR